MVIPHTLSDLMARVYKHKGGKLVLYLPENIIRDLRIEEGEEMDFFRFNDKAFIFAKKSDILNMLVGTDKAQSQKAQESDAETGTGLSEAGIAVLRKLDTMRYKDRTKDAVERMLDESEKYTLARLVKQKAVTLYKKDKDSTPLYGISREIYDRFLMRNKAPQAKNMQAPGAFIKAAQAAPAENRQAYGNLDASRVKDLELSGFIVLQTEAEASSLSLAIEESIRQGLVLGTRAFNRKFYIVMRSFLTKHSDKILKIIRNGPSRVQDIAKETGIAEDGARAILYLLAESGDISEKKRDVFVVA